MLYCFLYDRFRLWVASRKRTQQIFENNPHWKLIFAHFEHIFTSVANRSFPSQFLFKRIQKMTSFDMKKKSIMKYRCVSYIQNNTRWMLEKKFGVFLSLYKVKLSLCHATWIIFPKKPLTFRVFPPATYLKSPYVRCWFPWSIFSGFWWSEKFCLTHVHIRKCFFLCFWLYKSYISSWSRK